MKRRDFLMMTAAVTSALAARKFSTVSDFIELEPEAEAAMPSPGQVRRGDMLYRKLGRTGIEVSAIGLGGYHVAVPDSEQETIRIIRSAVDRGVNFLDNCWSYHSGKSEERMGKALKDGYRKKVFLMTKVEGRTAEKANAQLEDCLRRLSTETIDLVQVHEVIRLDDGDRMFEQNGAISALVAAKKAGKIRFIGFTGHKDPLVHLRTLDVAKAHGFEFDTVQMPLNLMDAHFRSFEKQVLPRLVREGRGVIAMKPLASAAIPESGAASAIECLQYALNLPASTVVTGIDSIQILDQALEAVRTFQPLSKAKLAALLKKTEKLALTGKYERFKTSDHFDSTAQHPEWLG